MRTYLIEVDGDYPWKASGKFSGIPYVALIKL